MKVEPNETLMAFASIETYNMHIGTHEELIAVLNGHVVQRVIEIAFRRQMLKSVALTPDGRYVRVAHAAEVALGKEHLTGSRLAIHSFDAERGEIELEPIMLREGLTMGLRADFHITDSTGTAHASSMQDNDDVIQLAGDGPEFSAGLAAFYDKILVNK